MRTAALPESTLPGGKGGAAMPVPAQARPAGLRAAGLDFLALPWVAALVVGLLSLALGSAWLWQDDQTRLALAREQALYLAKSHAQVLQRNVERGNIARHLVSRNHARETYAVLDGQIASQFLQAIARWAVTHNQQAGIGGCAVARQPMQHAVDSVPVANESRESQHQCIGPTDS